MNKGPLIVDRPGQQTVFSAADLDRLTAAAEAQGRPLRGEGRPRPMSAPPAHKPPAAAAPAAPVFEGEARRAAILDLPSARGRGPLAESVALATSMTVAQADALLRTAPVDPDEDAALESARVQIAFRGAEATPPADGWIARRLAQDACAAAAPLTARSEGAEAAEASAIVLAFRNRTSGDQ